MSRAIARIYPIERIDATPNSCLANEFYEFFATPKLVLLLVTLAWP